MSKHSDAFDLPFTPDMAKQLCAYAISSVGLRLDRDLGFGYSCSERFEFGFTYPVTIIVSIAPDPRPGMSMITLAGSNFGFGPIQSSHVRDRVFGLRRCMEQLAQQSLAQSNAPPAAPEPPPQPAS